MFNSQINSNVKITVIKIQNVNYYIIITLELDHSMSIKS